MNPLSALALDKHRDRDDILALWKSWWSSKDVALRERLIEHYLPFARNMAAKLYRKRHCEELEFDDYMQLATIGLMESIDRYAPNSSAVFTTYATKRITGSVLNGVAHLNEKQQQINAHQRLISERNTVLADSLQSKLPEDNVFEQLAEIAIGLAIGYILDDTGLYLDDEPVQPDNQYRDIELRQLRERLLELVEQLPERERLLIKYNYFNHISFDTVAQHWGVSRSRIAQLHRGALDRLRKAALHLRHYDVIW